MKHAVMLPVLAALLFAGCVYESPLTEENKISVDAAVLGLWEEVKDGDGRMMILKYSDTEYLIHYPVGKDGY